MTDPAALAPRDCQAELLGPATRPSPLLDSGRRIDFVEEGTRVPLVVETGPTPDPRAGLSFEKAGPRRALFFDPSTVTAAVVTCGGLAPGLNNVIRSVFMQLEYGYGARAVLGLREGYRGLVEGGPEPLVITKDVVRHIHDRGGTLLGTSRGPQEPARMVDRMEQLGIDMLFCVGGDGTQRGAHAIQEEVARRGQARAVVGVPKTIDNDIPYNWMSFGYVTALSKAEEVLRAAHEEAHAVGRNAGYIAAGAAVASQEANFVLVPEVPFPLDGFLEALRERVRTKGHALVVVAEGAGQHLFEGEAGGARDASGNPRHRDIGLFLKDTIAADFAAAGLEVNLKYLDPSYLIRGIPAVGWDRVLSDRMARNAVHAAMSGRTDTLIGFLHGTFVHLPIGTATAQTRRMEIPSELWSAVLSATGQPSW